MTGEELMVEIKGIVSVELVVAQATALLHNPAELARRRARLAATMPPPGAAKHLLSAIMADL